MVHSSLYLLEENAVNVIMRNITKISILNHTQITIMLMHSEHFMEKHRTMMLNILCHLYIILEVWGGSLRVFPKCRYLTIQNIHLQFFRLRNTQSCKNVKEIILIFMLSNIRTSKTHFLFCSVALWSPCLGLQRYVKSYFGVFDPKFNLWCFFCFKRMWFNVKM